MMNLDRTVVSIGLILGLAVVGAAVAAGTQSLPPSPAKPKPKAEDVVPLTKEQLEANWQKASTPGVEHKVLESFVGHWTSHTRMQMELNRPVEESDGTAEGRMVLGSRFVHVVHKGTMMGQPFEGLMLTGYDNIAKKFVASWADNQSTAIVRYDGTYDKNSKKLMMGSRFMDPMTWKPATTRSVTTFVSPTSWTYEEFAPGPYGKERVLMTVVFTKKG
jgi:hypothetical protein